MNKNLSLAICILFFEKAEQTIECVESFLGSGVPIYVLNNNSSVESTEKLKTFCANFSQVKIFASPENLGVSGGRNFLIKNTQEGWLFFVDNDITIKTTDWLEKIEKHIQHNRSFDAFIPKLYNTAEKNYSIFKPFSLKNKLVQRDEDYQGDCLNMFPGGASVIKRNLFEKLGLYEEKMFVGFEDFEFAIRGMVAENPIKAKLITDIELIHDHRIAKSEADKQSARVRYDAKKLKVSHDFIAEKYGIYLNSNWKYWVKNKMNYFVEGKTAKPISRFEVILTKISNKLNVLKK